MAWYIGKSCDFANERGERRCCALMISVVTLASELTKNLASSNTSLLHKCCVRRLGVFGEGALRALGGVSPLAVHGIHHFRMALQLKADATLDFWQAPACCLQEASVRGRIEETFAGSSKAARSAEGRLSGLNHAAGVCLSAAACAQDALSGVGLRLTLTTTFLAEEQEVRIIEVHAFGLNPGARAMKGQVTVSTVNPFPCIWGLLLTNPTAVLVRGL